jgi:hypothetical protein
VSVFYHRSSRVSDINLTETCHKADRLIFTLTEPDSCPNDMGMSHFFKAETITVSRVLYLSFLLRTRVRKQLRAHPSRQGTFARSPGHGDRRNAHSGVWSRAVPRAEVVNQR